MSDKFIEAVKKLNSNWDSKADEYAKLVKDGMMTAEEAAQALAGSDLKVRDEIRNTTEFRPGPGGDIMVARQAIDSRLPGYNGLIPGLHV